MSDKKTAEEIAKTIPCQCSDCGMRESEATQMIQAYADQELASLREQLKREKENDDHQKFVLKNCLSYLEVFKSEWKEGEEVLSEEIKGCFANRNISTSLTDQLKQKEDENREMIAIIKNIKKAFDYSNRVYSDWLATKELDEAMKPVFRIISRLSAKLGKV